MDVTCDKCRTEYEFDESLISESGTTVKCTNCGHLFRIYQPGTPEARRKPAWMLKQPDGSVYTFERMTTLQRWIAEGKVSRDDVVSRDGMGWQSLGEMTELASFFESGRDALAAREEDFDWGDDGPTIQRPSPRRAQSAEPRAPAAAPDAPGPTARSPNAPALPKPAPGPPPLGSRPAPAAPPVAAQPSAAGATKQGEEWTQGALLEAQSPAWTAASSSSQTIKPGDQEPAWAENRISAVNLDLRSSEEEPPPKQGRLLKVGVPVLLIGLVVVGVGGLYLLRPQLFHHLLSQIVTSGGEEQSGSLRAYLRGREFFLADTTEDFRQADREYHRSDSHDGLTQAGLAELYTTWSQYYLDDVADYRLRASKAEPNEASASLGRAELRQEEFQKKLEQARRFVDAALKKAPTSAEAQRAAADYYRLAGDVTRATDHINLALEQLEPTSDVRPETEYVQALVELATTNDVEGAVQKLRSVLTRNNKLQRCHYRLARLLGSQGQLEGARESLEKVLALNGEHERAKRLQAELQRDPPLLIAVTATAFERTGLAAGAGTTDAGADGAPAEAGPEVAVADTGPATDSGPAARDDAAPAAVAVAGAPIEESFDVLIRRASKAQANGAGDACPMFRRADKMRGGHPEVLVGLGYCAADSGNRSQAISYYQRALSGNGSYGPALLALASAYRSQGNNRQALDTYQRYLSAHPGGSQAGIARRNVARIQEELDESRAAQPEDPATPPGPPPPSSSPEADPAPPPPSPPSATEPPTVTRISEDRSPPAPRTDSLATDSEPPLRPGENLE